MVPDHGSLRPGPHAGAGRPGQQPPRLVLLVDDDRLFAAMGRDLLQARGYEVRTASSGPEALEAARAMGPDLILLDIQMPGMDGIEACRRLKADPRTKEAPVVFLTATLDPQLHLRALRAGGVSTVCKTFSVDVLPHLVHVLLAARHGVGAPAHPDQGRDRAGALFTPKMRESTLG